MKILFVAAEVAPFATVGGLSQVMYFLPRALKKLGHDVRIFTPKYGVMDKTAPKRKGWRLKTEIEGLKIPIQDSGSASLICNIKSFRGRKYDPFTYFLENREYYELRANVYEYKDDHIRFALLSKGCLEWLRAQRLAKKGSKVSAPAKAGKKPAAPQPASVMVDPSSGNLWFPDIIHCHDWHTGYLVDLARRNQRYKDLLSKRPILFTVHNFSMQGNFEFRYAAPEDRDAGQSRLAPLLSSTLIKQNALLRGLICADAVSTVSPTHAVEVLTPEYAEGLEGILQEIRGKLTGILNGLDTHEFNPATDTIIKKQFNTRSCITARDENKRDLQGVFSLPHQHHHFLTAISGRLSVQKGWDLLLEVLPHLLKEKPELQLVVLGGGPDRYRQELTRLKKQFPRQIGLHLRPDFRLPRKIFAGADAFLIPSLFEPGGIVALEALRYGAVPIVRRTGGLSDIVADFDPATKIGNGFSFVQKNPWALYGAIIEAYTVFKQPKLWQRLIRNCLRADFSWNHVAREYDDWYRRVRRERQRAVSKTPHPAYGPGVPVPKDPAS